MPENVTFLHRRIHEQMRLIPEQYTGPVTILEKGSRKDIERPHYRNVWVTEMIEGVPIDYEAIEINFTDIEGNQVYLEKGSSKGKPYTQLRWDIIPTKYPHDAKYKLPGGNGTRPFFPQYLKQFYETGMQYDHLFITEGAFKADVATCNKLFTVGLTSITHSADKEHKDYVHTDIIKLIEVNRPTRITVIWDGDCRNFSRGDFEKHNDLNRRPGIFYKTVRSIKERLRNSGYTGEVWFACPRSLALPGNPKGLDDLLLTEGIRPADVREDLESKHEGETAYFHKLNISTDLSKLSRFFLQDGVDSFYNHHRQLLKDVPFTWEGSKYKYDEKEGHCIRLLSVEMKEFLIVGDSMFRRFQRPTAYGDFDEIIMAYSRGVFKEEYGKEAIAHLPRYKAFITRPDHFSHTPVIHDCYNLYNKFDWPQEECDLQEFEKNSATFKYIRHVFGHNEETGMPNHVPLFLDYFKILYEKPTEHLPAPCLVSKERKTGKSTYNQWMRAIFKMNCLVIGNDTLEDSFNETWSSKLLICIDEALIESRKTMEMIKRLMTERKMVVRRMNKAGVPEDFFGKFSINSNNVEDFIWMDVTEDRFWVRYVPRFEGKEDPNLLDKLTAEIPQFLYYVANHRLQHQKQSRFWFERDAYHTIQAVKLMSSSRSHTEKALEEALEKQFDKIPDVQYLYYTKKELLQIIQDNVGERETASRLRKCLTRLGYPSDANSIKYDSYECTNGADGITWVPVAQFGRAYKFKRGLGIEVFAPAKERHLTAEQKQQLKTSTQLITTAPATETKKRETVTDSEKTPF